MKSADKKTEKSIVIALTQVCETCKHDLPGFSWLTHFVDYSKFPLSLKIVVVFDTEQHLNTAKDNPKINELAQFVQSKLLAEGVRVSGLGKSLFFDSEENGADVDSSKWVRKFAP